MDHRLKRLIDEYVGSVRMAVALLEETGIPRAGGDYAWALNGIPGTGALRGDVTYRKHGYGCEVRFASGSVDFDFGRTGRIDGFDAWRLADFTGDRLPAFGFVSRDELEQAFNNEVRSGDIFISASIFHYVAEGVDEEQWPG